MIGVGLADSWGTSTRSRPEPVPPTSPYAFRRSLLELQPWAFGVRLRHEPEEVQRFTVKASSAAAGRTIDDLADFPAEAWVSIVVRNGRLLPAKGDTDLRVGDEILVVADPNLERGLKEIFEGPSTP